MKRILVVDDDVDTIVVMGKALTAFGFDGVPVTSCADAREVAARFGGIDAVVTDLRLRDGDGVELGRELRRAYGCKVAIMSGDPAPHGGLPAGIDVWLHKPVDLPRLRSAVESLLA